MPIFEYECAKCKKEFEVLASPGSVKKMACPFCSSRRVTKLFSSFSTISKGGESSASRKASRACTSCASKKCSTCG